ncbi:TPA: hypothetical protein L7439_002462 [Klebsiella pneumoniae]|jgi:hypothetical protein|nr:hypothetical protein [Klebsiella pneumoniae]HBQ5219795.1 hypothetical protein [Klebsiella pneumoniae]HBQ5378551.1 hypothetical protein [Klebsiella pneumoniae]HBX5817076.1 hypothetical protein [Klebsiella pneumoniae]HBZ3659813.1 hypothetical protein [Klebsiella pneumoniae]
MTDITELAQEARINAGCGEYLSPAETMELVEALEKAQQRITELEQKHCGGALMERELAHSEVINKLMSEIDNRDSRIAELESRTVKLPDDEDGQAYGFGKWSNSKLPATAGTMTIAYCEDAWRAAFEVFSSAAGIKVEAE